MTTRNRKIFLLTEGTIRSLARELVSWGEMQRSDITPEMVQKVKVVFLINLRDWDTWIQEVIIDLVHKAANNRPGS